MSTLTQSERDGLDDAFLSIHSSNNNYNRIKELSTFVISKKKSFSIKKLLKQANYGIKQRGFSHFLAFNTRKKKNLSK